MRRRIVKRKHILKKKPTASVLAYRAERKRKKKYIAAEQRMEGLQRRGFR